MLLATTFAPVVPIIMETQTCAQVHCPGMRFTSKDPCPCLPPSRTSSRYTQSNIIAYTWVNYILSCRLRVVPHTNLHNAQCLWAHSQLDRITSRRLYKCHTHVLSIPNENTSANYLWAFWSSRPSLKRQKAFYFFTLPTAKGFDFGHIFYCKFTATKHWQ